jgi:cation:H+ antiporter
MLMDNIEVFNTYAFLLIGIAVAVPDLLLGIIALRKGKEDLAVGLIIGGVIYDMIVSIAIQGFVNPLYNISEIYITLLLIANIVSVCVALIYIRTQWKLRAWECMILILAYIGIIVYLLLII